MVCVVCGGFAGVFLGVFWGILGVSWGYVRGIGVFRGWGLVAWGGGMVWCKVLILRYGK